MFKIKNIIMLLALISSIFIISSLNIKITNGKNEILSSVPDWQTSWSLVGIDDDDGVTSSVEILKVEFTEDSLHYMFNITTETDIQTSNTIGVLIDENNSGIYDYVISSYYSIGGLFWGSLLRYWDDTRWQDKGDTYTYAQEHVLVNNNGHHGILLATHKSNLPISIELESDMIKIVSTDVSGDTFGDGIWTYSNDPDTQISDFIFSPLVPEFDILQLNYLYFVIICIITILIWKNKEIK